MSLSQFSASALIDLANAIKSWGLALGFQQVGITDTDLGPAEKRFQQWLAKGYQGDMHYLSRHGVKRSRPQELIPNTLRVISVRMDYLPPQAPKLDRLKDRLQAIISCYALGRDYHKLMRKRLEQLAERIRAAIGDFHYRAFCDSAPVLEKPLAEKAGLGWIGKHTNLINAKAGSWFFLGALYTDLPLPCDIPVRSHCGSCQACLDICPTQAIVAPYQLDARRCISYLTIELRGSIPVALRPLIGNRIYGCDDCQLICPWNKFASQTKEIAFHSRAELDNQQLIKLFRWSEQQFIAYTEGSAIRRIGYECWLRNIAVALGNAPFSVEVKAALLEKINHPSALVREHVAWALKHNGRRGY